MWLLRRVACLILILSLVSLPVYAEQKPQDALPIPTASQLQTIAETVGQNVAGYSLSPKQEEELAQETQKQIEQNSHIVKFGQAWFVSSLKAFITSVVIIGVGEVHKRAHERNLQLTPANIKQLSDEGNCQLFR